MSKFPLSGLPLVKFALFAALNHSKVLICNSIRQKFIKKFNLYFEELLWLQYQNF